MMMRQSPIVVEDGTGNNLGGQSHQRVRWIL